MAVSDLQQQKVCRLNFGFERRDAVVVQASELQLRLQPSEQLAEIWVEHCWIGALRLELVDT